MLDMNSAANKLRSPLRLLIAAILLLMLPFIGITPRAAAMDNHRMHTADTSIDCASACARAVSIPLPQTVKTENQNQLPDPATQDTLPYHVQFAAVHIPRVLKPAAFYRSSPARPPDILKLSGNLRF